MENNELISNRLLEWFDGRRQNVMAQRLGISQATLSQIIRGRRKITADVIFKLAEKGCDINWLLTGKSINK